MRRLLKWTFVFIVTLSFLSLAPRLIGAQAKPPAVIALLDPGICPQPCWQGIRPGFTTFRQTEALFRGNMAPTPLNDSLYYDFCWFPDQKFRLEGCVRKDPESYERGEYYLHSLFVQIPPKSLRLGDALVLFGVPRWVENCEYPGVLIKYVSGLKIALYGDMYGEPLRLDTPVAAIIYSVPDSSHGGDDHWRGFTQHVLCQLE
jgi:hypothetical protein